KLSGPVPRCFACRVNARLAASSTPHGDRRFDDVAIGSAAAMANDAPAKIQIASRFVIFYPWKEQITVSEGLGGPSDIRFRSTTLHVLPRSRLPPGPGKRAA